MAEYDNARVLAFLQDRWGGRGCPVCGKGPLALQDKVFQLTEFHQGSLVIGGPLVPVLPVTCNNCGNTLLVNAIVCGAVKPEAPKRDKAADSDAAKAEAGT